ncbi:hypothetical protein SLU01_21450 [Sporosarcina luteola]|uniref:Uncharacterized protein n=1 Tax=Sporosarcina luteola TaxID=582850 RepID=A0A511Z8U1_9BACL|nr:hypothetical protein [Sporosarcina luteola]GEN83833.1 hypothetical protein SLU01_21450 [Sporosarcina luteola]
MSVQHYHALCSRHIGRSVVIGTRDGRTHRGIIQGVRNNRVYIQPFGRQRNLGGFGYGFGYGYGFGGRGRGIAFAFGIALGAIATFALIPFW